MGHKLRQFRRVVSDDLLTARHSDRRQALVQLEEEPAEALPWPIGWQEFHGQIWLYQ